MVISRLGGMSGGQAWEIVTDVIVVLSHSHILHPVSPREILDLPIQPSWRRRTRGIERLEKRSQLNTHCGRANKERVGS